jgi:serine/threonine protein kinase
LPNGKVLVAGGYGSPGYLEDLGDTSLRRLLDEQRLDLRTCLRIACSLATALAAIHHRHVIHKDIKPQNISVDPATCKATLLDFGIATCLSRCMATSPGRLRRRMSARPRCPGSSRRSP